MTWALRKLAVGILWLGMQTLMLAIYYDEWRRR